MLHQRSAFQTLLEKSGMTLAEAATYFGVSERQIRRYCNEECDPPMFYVNSLHEVVEADAKRRARRAEFRFIDLFAGIGGMRLGFEAAGGECVFTSEWDPYSRKTYARNFNDGADHPFAGDITQVRVQDIPEHDVLVAGFPCQPFSIAGVSKKNSLGMPHGFDCTTQGTLFFDVERILAHHRPKAFLLENVKNLQRHDKGRTFSVIMETLRNKLGYKLVAHKVISSHPWVPQKRERIFIVGFRDGADFSFAAFDSRIPPQEDHPTLGDILQPDEQVDEKYTLTAHLWSYLQRYKEKHTAQGNGFGFGLFGRNDVTRTLSARYYKDGSEILVRQGKGRRPRRLTPKECARLMGFENSSREWHIPVSDTQAYKQFGNAVVVPVVEAVAMHMKPFLVDDVRNTAPATSDDLVGA